MNIMLLKSIGKTVLGVGAMVLPPLVKYIGEKDASAAMDAKIEQKVAEAVAKAMEQK